MFFALSSKEAAVTLCKLKWSDDKRALFEQNLNLPENLSETERARSLIKVDVNEAVSVFTGALSKVASCLVKKQSGNKGFSNEWYDKECRDMRSIKRKMLQTIQSMYRIVKARIPNGNNVTDAFFVRKV